MCPEAEFRKQVAAFRRWADYYASTDTSHGWEYGAEWDCNYGDWPAIWAATEAFLEANQPAQWHDEVAEELLYIVARDGEDEWIKEELAERPIHLLALAKRGLHSPEREARWQLADALGVVDAADAEVESLLMQFCDDSDEYVSRRALLATGNRRCAMAEAVALRAWNTGLEYRQMAELDVLSQIGSAQFAALRDAAGRDPRQSLADYAKTLRVTGE